MRSHERRKNYPAKEEKAILEKLVMLNEQAK